MNLPSRIHFPVVLPPKAQLFSGASPFEISMKRHEPTNWPKGWNPGTTLDGGQSSAHNTGVAQ